MKIFKKLKEEKTQKQIIKLLYTAIVCLALLLVVELMFQIPAIANMFSTDLLSDTMSNNITVWVVLWLLMFAQVTIIPVPAMPIYVFCNNTYLVAAGSGILDLLSLRTLFFVLYVTSACVVGAICAYLLGKLCGRRAVKWIIGDTDEYEEWTQKLNCRTGKWVYAATVFLPIFPDDIICLVAGAIKLDFKFYVFINTVGRVVTSMCYFIFLRLPYISNFFKSSVNGGFPWALLAYSILLFICINIVIIYKLCKKLKKSP